MSVLRPYSGLFVWLQRTMDGVIVMLTLVLVTLELHIEWNPMYTWAAGIGAGIFVVIGEMRRLYASWRLQSLDDEFGNVMLVWAATCCVLIVIAFLSKVSASYSRVAIVSWFLCTPALFLGVRLAARGLLRNARRSGRNTRSVAIVGATPLASDIVSKIRETSSFGLKLIGIFDDRSRARVSRDGSAPSLIVGDSYELLNRARRGEVDYVFIALPMKAESRIVHLVNQLADTTSSVYVIPNFFIFDLMRARLTLLGGMPAISVYESPFDGIPGIIKRLEDIVLGSILLVAAALPMLVIAICLKASSPGSILFKQQRYGLNGRVVRVWKFRTMTVSEDGADVIQARKQDPRITPIGRILRATSLDELPQLFNVLGGSMSLVGPRPHAVKVNEDFRRLVHGYMLRHKVKPGITGWAQVNGWHGEDTVEKMRKRVEHDLAYLQEWSLWLDIKILFMTAVAIFARRKDRAAAT